MGMHLKNFRRFVVRVLEVKKRRYWTGYVVGMGVSGYGLILGKRDGHGKQETLPI